MLNQVIQNSEIRRETLDGTEYVVAPVTLLKPMYLNTPGDWSANEAYLPESEAKNSIPSWNGTPLTLNHPTMNGHGTTANSPEIHSKSVLGRVFNVEWDGSEVVGEAWFNESKIREMGGQAENALERVLNGDSVEVSTGYRASKLPSGDYDGDTHTAVQGNLKPDHLAVLPNQQGKCSIDAGCGVGAPVANMIVTNAKHTVSEGDIVEWESSGGMAMGVVRDTITEGQYDSEIGGDVTVSAPAALIEIVNETDEGLEPTGTMVGHKTDTDTLSMVEDPPELVENQDVPDEYRFDNPGEAMSKAQDMGLSAIHTHGEGDDTIFMPGESHEALVEHLDDMAENQLSEARTPTFDGTETTSWADVSKDLESWADALDIDADTVADMSSEQKQTVADHTLLGDPDADTWQELSYFPVVNPSNQNLNRGALMAVLSGRGAQADIPSDTLKSARSVAESLLESEFEEDMSENGALRQAYNSLKRLFKSSTQTTGAESLGDTASNSMSDKTQELVDNHGFKADNLPDEDTECFEAIYNRFVEEESTETETNTETADNVKEITEAELEELISNRVDERLEERQEQDTKESLAAAIVGNSTEYDSTDAVLNDYPTEAALETKKKDVVGSTPDFSGSVGANAQPATNTEDADDLKMFGSDA